MKIAKLSLILFSIFILSCNSKNNSENINTSSDSIITSEISTDTAKINIDTTATEKEISKTTSPSQNTNKTKVFVYNFHVTNRCPSCIAIEEATTKTLKMYYKKEFKEGTLIRLIINADDEVNKELTEKYEIYGSSLIVVKNTNGKETKVDLTGDGFKYAKNKEEKFIEILKKQIDQFLK